MNSAAYEELVASIAKHVFEAVDELDETDIGYGSKNRISGASGYHHQIDVSVPGISDLYLIECKCWAKPIPVEAVLAFFGRIQDINSSEHRVVHGTVATTVGFQPGAEKVAKHFGIHLVKIKSEFSFALYFKGSIWNGLTGAESPAQGGQVTVKISN